MLRTLTIVVCVSLPLTLCGLTKAHVFHVDHTDDEVQLMDMETLLHVENDLRKQNGIVDQHASSLRNILDDLNKKQRDLERINKKIESAKNWEIRQKLSRLRELDRAKAEMESKRMQIELLAQHGQKLHENIHDFEVKLQTSYQKRKLLEDRFDHPSLKDVLVHEAGRMGPVAEKLTNKTMESLAPQLWGGLQRVLHVRSGLVHDSPFSIFLTSACLYVAGLMGLLLSYRGVKTARRSLTLPRLLFITDMSLGVMWMLIFLCYGVVLCNPFELMSKYHATLSLVLQIVIMVLLIGSIVLRCFAFAVALNASFLLELLFVLVVFQDYSHATWEPILAKGNAESGCCSYLVYFVVYGGLGVYRARSMKNESAVIKTPDEAAAGRPNVQSWLSGFDFQRAWEYCEDLLTFGFAATKEFWDPAEEKKTPNDVPQPIERATRQHNVYARYHRKQRNGRLV